jgi:hypothetical protein
MPQQNNMSIDQSRIIEIIITYLKYQQREIGVIQALEKCKGLCVGFTMDALYSALLSIYNTDQQSAIDDYKWYVKNLYQLVNWNGQKLPPGIALQLDRFILMVYITQYCFHNLKMGYGKFKKKLLDDNQNIGLKK